MAYVFLFLLLFQSNGVLLRYSKVISNCYTSVLSTSQCQLKYFVIIYSFKYNQQDATLCNILYYVNALHVSGGFSAHHQELENCTHSIWYVPGLLAATASGRSKQA